MAKKILYKVTAYHCPRCGSACEPTKKYCDYCQRDLSLRRKDQNKNKVRLLIDCGNYVFFDEIKNIQFQERRESLEVTTLEDTYRREILAPSTYDFEIQMPLSDRGRELLKLGYTGIHKIRFEHLGIDQGFESEAYIGNSETDIYGDKAPMQTISFISVGNPIFGEAIPKEVMKELRCPNCGAYVDSRYGACRYCSGWIECMW